MSEQPLAPQAPQALADLRTHINAEINHLGNGAPALLRTLEGDARHLMDAVLERYTRLGGLVTRLECTLEVLFDHHRTCGNQTPAAITLTAQEKA